MRRHHGRDLAGVERQRGDHQADLPARQDPMAPTALSCATTSRPVADLKGKNVASSAPGTSPYFMLAWVLNKNGMSTKDVTVVNLEPDAAAQAFLAGQNDAAVTYEPYLSAVRDKPDQGHIMATTLDYPMVLDTVGCTPEFLEGQSRRRQGAGRQLFRGARPDQERSAEILRDHGRRRETDRPRNSGIRRKYLKWADKAENKQFFTKEFQDFSKTAGDLLLQMGADQGSARCRRRWPTPARCRTDGSAFAASMRRRLAPPLLWPWRSMGTI